MLLPSEAPMQMRTMVAAKTAWRRYRPIRSVGCINFAHLLKGVNDTVTLRYECFQRHRCPNSELWVGTKLKVDGLHVDRSVVQR